MQIFSETRLSPRSPTDTDGTQVALVDLYPWTTEDRLETREELQRVPLLDEKHSTCVGMTMATAEDEIMHATLKKNIDMFAWTSFDMLGVSSNIITHKLSVFKEARPIAQKKRDYGDEKRLAAKAEAEKLQSVRLYARPNIQPGWTMSSWSPSRTVIGGCAWTIETWIVHAWRIHIRSPTSTG